MNQEWLFATVPYLALAVGTAGVVWRLGTRKEKAALDRERSAFRRLLVTSPAWRLSMSAILAGHLVGLALPRQVLLWNQHPLRLLVLEVTGMALACVALASLAAGLQFWRRDAAGPAISRADTVLVTLLGVSILSGLGTALLHRWASSWSMSTMVPYVRSLFLLAPDVSGMASLPFLARLHAVAFFAALAVLPFTSVGVLLTATGVRQQDVVLES